ncbi:hypothetical protein F5Y19DRAFT_487352 [Xylariaceae sp. FL1651]|nr:hypothetical protein F5Y19DRAFT_487352 [Xylariaceae sp. FL1651]
MTGGNSVGDAIETTVKCCPFLSYSFECNTKAVGSDWGVFADCTTLAFTLEVDFDVIGAVPTSKLVGSSRDAAGNPILTHAIINGYGIEVRWQQTDEALLFGRTASSTLPPTASDSSPSATTVQMANSSRPNAGLIVGIVVGSLVAVLVLLGIIVVIVRSKRRRRPKMTSQATPSHSGCNHGMHTCARPELSGPDPMGVFPKYELPIPAPTAVIPRQELPVEQMLLNTAHTTQCHLVYRNKNLQEIASCGNPAVVPTELEALEQRGELEADVGIIELSDTERRGKDRLY